MLVRLLRWSDLQDVSDLLRQLGYDISSAELASRLDRVLATEAHYAAVAEDGGKTVGLIHAYERPALEKACEAVVQSLVVDRQARKSGVGTLLMAGAETWARKRGVEHVVLHTRVDRDDARAFYEHIGYNETATSYLMSKSITPA
jgi:GNAT superfamily N-acetyltransferase